MPVLTAVLWERAVAKSLSMFPVVDDDDDEDDGDDNDDDNENDDDDDDDDVDDNDDDDDDEYTWSNVVPLALIKLLPHPWTNRIWNPQKNHNLVNVLQNMLKDKYNRRNMYWRIFCKKVSYKEKQIALQRSAFRSIPM